MKRYKSVWLILLSVGFGIGFFWAQQTHRPRIQIGGHSITIDRRAVPDPKRNYTLQYWDYDLPLGSPAGGGASEYRRYLARAVAAFQKRYPRIKVAITLLDLSTGPDRLASALQHNTAPDVYASLFQIPPPDYRRQIPAGLFLTAAEMQEYPLALRRLVQEDQYLWAIPRWTVPGLWIARRELLAKAGLPVSRLRAAGWSWAQLAGFAAQLPAGQAVLAANPAANGFFRQLAANAALEANPETDSGRAAWNGRSVGAVLDLLERIGSSRPSGAVICRDFLPRFLKGRAAVLAGARPVILPLLRQEMPDLVFLPVPGRIARRAVMTAENGVLCVYRNRRSQGDDQIAAAVKFARFLSCYREVDPWLKMMVIPAAKSVAALWREKAAPLLTAPEAAYLVAVAQGARLQNLNELPEYQPRIYPALVNFLAGKTTPAQAQALMFHR